MAVWQIRRPRPPVAGSLFIKHEVCHVGEIREWCGFREITLTDLEDLKQWLIDEVIPQESREDGLREALLQYCRQLKIEPPAMDHWQRLILSALQEHDTCFCDGTFRGLDAGTVDRMDSMLQPSAAEGDEAEWTIWQSLKAEPGKAGVASVKEASGRLALVRGIGLPSGFFKDVPSKLVEHFYKRAAMEEPFELRRQAVSSRATLQVSGTSFRRSAHIGFDYHFLLIPVLHHAKPGTLLCSNSGLNLWDRVTEMQPRIFSNILLSLGLHAGAAYLLITRFPELGLPLHWLSDSVGLVAISALLALVPFMLPSKDALIACLTLRSFLYAFLALPLGDSLWLVFGLAFALIFDAGARLLPTASTMFGTAIAALSLLRALVPFHAWGRDVSGTLTAENLFGFITLGIVLLLAHAVSTLRMAARKDAELARQLNESILSLTNANQGFLTYASEVERASILTERNHLTREMHDVLSHTLTNLRMMMEAALRRDWEEKGELQRLHEWTRDQAQQGLQEMRSILHHIRGMEEPEVKGVRQIQNLIRIFMEATKVAVIVDWGNIPWSWQNDYVNITVFRIIQESMTNAFRHGHATEINIYFFQGPTALNIRIEDNGSGSNDFKKGIGLASMEERLKPIDGMLSANSTDSGFRLHVRIPTSAYRSITEA